MKKPCLMMLALCAAVSAAFCETIDLSSASLTAGQDVNVSGTANVIGADPMCRITVREGGDLTLCQSSDTRILGTMGYAPPEQYGLSQTDRTADIYALGVLINVLLTGKHPSIKLASGRWGRIVSRCTMTSPKKRYQTVQAVREAL